MNAANTGNIRDILNDFFLSNISGDTLTVTEILLNMGAGLLIGLLIFVVYRVTHTGEVYSARFNVSLVMLALISTMVMTAIGSNVALSLGLVGALSIVRFRTAVKDFMDTVFMFWAIVNGIICGAGFVLISVIASLAVGALILAVYYLGGVAQRDLYLVVVRTKDDVPFAGLSPLLDKAEIKSCSSAGGLQETIVETRLNSKQLTALRSLTDKAGVISVDIVAYNTKTGL